MNKKLIALALAALPAAAMADVTMYGIMKIGIENTKTDFGASYDHSQNRIDDYGSRIGFKGTEDLGDGLKAIWQVEQGIRLDGVDHDGKAAQFYSRDTFVGLDMGEFGKVRLGRLSTELNDPLSIVDFWEYDEGANGLGVFTRTGDRLNNAIRYDSADWYGFNFNLIYGTYEHKGTEDLYPGAGVYRNSNIGGVGLNYQNSGFFASYGFEYRGDDYIDINSNDDKWGTGYVHRVELGYNANNLFVGLGYQYTKGANSWFNTTDSSGMLVVDPTGGLMSGLLSGEIGGIKTNELALSIGYTIGAFTPKFTYAHGWDMKTASGDYKLDDTGYDQFIIGVDYAMSKRTTLGFAWGETRFGKGLNLGNYGYDANGNLEQTGSDKINYSTFSLNMIHKF